MSLKIKTFEELFEEANKINSKLELISKKEAKSFNEHLWYLEMWDTITFKSSITYYFEKRGNDGSYNRCNVASKDPQKIYNIIKIIKEL